MKLLLITTVVLFYMHSFRIANAQDFSQVTPTDVFKDCVSYEVSTTKQNFEESKATCKQLGGKMASSDLTNSVFAAKATEVAKIYRKSSGWPIWIGVYTDENVDEDTKFYFLNGQEMTDAKMSFKWGMGKVSHTSGYLRRRKGVPPNRNPKNHKNFKCGRILTSKNDIFNSRCGNRNPVLCMVPNRSCVNEKLGWNRMMESKLREMRDFASTLLL